MESYTWLIGEHSFQYFTQKWPRRLTLTGGLLDPQAPTWIYILKTDPIIMKFDQKMCFDEFFPLQK